MKRRTALGVVGAGVVGPALMGFKSVGAAALKLDPQNPDHVMLIHRKLAYSMAADPAFMWLKATRYGLVDSKLTPFWDMHVGQAFATKDLPREKYPEGGYEVTMWAGIFYTDIATGKFLDHFHNPFTGKTVAIRYNPPRVVKRVYRNLVEEREPLNRPEMNITRTTGVGPAWIENDMVWVRGDTATRMEPREPEKARMSQVNDWSTYSGRLSEVADPQNPNPRANWIFNDINTWPAWLEMGDQPGNYVSRGLGQNELKFENMPSAWRKMLAEQYPGYAKDPVAPLKT
ncbi:MAG: DUF1838 family protein [Rhodospirillaceae bacterium]|nr:DUF1838 family protein [Rhodospirillaceae bacterium]